MLFKNPEKQLLLCFEPAAVVFVITMEKGYITI